MESRHTDTQEGSPRQNQCDSAQALVTARGTCPAFGRVAPEKALRNCLSEAKLQLTKVPTCRSLQALTFQPPAGLQQLSCKAADQILGHSPKSRGVTCSCSVVWRDRASASLPYAALLVLRGQHLPWVPALFPTNASSFLWKTSRDGKSFISVSNLSH